MTMGNAKKKTPPKDATKLTAVSSAGSIDTPLKQINARKTEELIVGICGPIGSGVSTVGRQIEATFKAHGYESDYFKISSFIRGLAEEKDEQKIDLQEEGNKLREKYGADILAQIVISEIHKKKNIQDLGNPDDANRKRRHITIVDSLKHPAEVELLTGVYGDMFFLFGTLCTHAARKERLKKKGLGEEKVIRLIEKDKKDTIAHGQQLLKTLKHADFFISNNKLNINTLIPPIERLVGLLLGKKDITPTHHEYGMYLAESAARRSGCLSRQVGAAILTKDGNIISTGRNDVPKAKGGLYTAEDGENDNRCFNWFDKGCFNYKYKLEIYQNLNEILEKQMPKETSPDLIKKITDDITENSRIKDLLEFSRSVHAEMDAITTAAREGLTSLKGTVLYSTTYPCHNCARHIVAAGIDIVYYIEPYEKSLATELHGDAIANEPPSQENCSNKVLFLHFEGVAPKQFLTLFTSGERKDNGRLIAHDPITCSPVLAKLLDTHVEYETKVIEYLSKLELDEAE